MADKQPRKNAPGSGDPKSRHPLAQPGAVPSRPVPRKSRPLPQGEQFFTPGASGVRKLVETRSAPLLVFLYQLPRFVVPVVLVALLLAAFVAQSWLGGLAVLPVLAFVSWLAYMSWPSLRFGARGLRVSLILFLVLLAATRFGAF